MTHPRLQPPCAARSRPPFPGSALSPMSAPRSDRLPASGPRRSSSGTSWIRPPTTTTASMPRHPRSRRPPPEVRAGGDGSGSRDTRPRTGARSSTSGASTTCTSPASSRGSPPPRWGRRASSGITRPWRSVSSRRTTSDTWSITSPRSPRYLQHEGPLQVHGADSHRVRSERPRPVEGCARRAGHVAPAHRGRPEHPEGRLRRHRPRAARGPRRRVARLRRGLLESSRGRGPPVPGALPECGSGFADRHGRRERHRCPRRRCASSPLTIRPSRTTTTGSLRGRGSFATSPG